MTAAYRVDVSDLAQQVLRHPLYDKVNDERGLRLFMQSHVFCVWDFQSLLKALQRKLTCVELPWLPTADPEARRLINEIVLDEESDIHPNGGYASHFEFYLEAMRECGADTAPIDRFIARLRAGAALPTAITEAELPPGVGDFLRTTFSFIDRDAHLAVAAFTHGREDILPQIFTELVQCLAARGDGRWDKFLYYLNRHIECDGERHGPISRALLARLCGTDAARWREAQATARASLQARIGLWDEIAKTL